jgi:hypothetical protein
MPVDTKNQAYEDWCKIWEKCRDAVEGQEAVHSKSTLYLPKLSGQTDQDYIAYRNRALYYNASQRTVDAMSGLLLRKDPKVEFPDAGIDWLDNIDLRGNSLDTFVEKVADEVVTVGRYGILVEFPVKSDDVISVADAERAGLRPFFTGYRAEDIINWNTTIVNNLEITSQVVLREFLTVMGEDEFTWMTVEKYRVLDLVEGQYRQRVFVKNDSSFILEQEFLPKINGNSFDFIPFTIISAIDCDLEVVKPPILDLVNVNLSHYKTTADLEHGAHFTGLPTAVITGHNIGEDETFKIGSTTAWVFAEEDAKAYYLEFTGQGLDALEKRIESKQSQMATLGARLLAPDKAAAETAEAHNIKRQGENSALASISQTISHGVERSLKILAEWGGLPSDDVVYELNSDFIPNSMSPQMLVALLQTWQSGGMSFNEFIRNLKSGEIIDNEKTSEDIKNEIDLEGPIGLTSSMDNENV